MKPVAIFVLVVTLSCENVFFVPINNQDNFLKLFLTGPTSSFAGCNLGYLGLGRTVLRSVFDQIFFCATAKKDWLSGMCIRDASPTTTHPTLCPDSRAFLIFFFSYFFWRE